MHINKGNPLFAREPTRTSRGTHQQGFSSNIVDYWLHWNSANVTQGAHIHQPTARPVRHSCAQPYHAGSDSHRQLFRPCWVPPACQSCWVNEQRRGEPASPKPYTAEVCAKQSINRQLHTTHVGAVGWEPHSSSTTTCAGRVDYELPLKARGTHTPTRTRYWTTRKYNVKSLALLVYASY